MSAISLCEDFSESKEGVEGVATSRVRGTGAMSPRATMRLLKDEVGWAGVRSAYERQREQEKEKEATGEHV